MRKLFFIQLLVMLVLILTAPATVLADTSDYLYYFTITVSNSTAADITTRAVATVNASALVAGSYIQADADDVYQNNNAISATDLSSTTAKWLIYPTVVPANGSVNVSVYTGDPDAAVRDQSFVSDADDFIYVPDDATLDINTNLTLKADVYLASLPAAEKEIISKEGNYELAVDNTNFIFRVWHSGAPTTVDSLPSGVGVQTGIATLFGAATHWEAVDDAVGAPDDATTYVRTSSGGATTGQDFYALPDGMVAAGSAISSVTVKYRSNGYGFGVVYTTPLLYLSGSTTVGTEINPAAGWNNYNEALAKPGGGNWSTSDLDSLQVGIRHRINSGGAVLNLDTTQVYVTVAYTPTDAGHTSSIVAATGTTKTITCTYDGAQTVISNGTISDTDALAGALHANSEPVSILGVDGVVDTIKIGSTNIAAPTWVDNFEFEADEISSTTITDLSASTNDATISTMTNPAGITVSVGGLQANSSAAAFSTEDDVDAGDNSGASGDWFEAPDGTVLGTNPLHPIVEVISDLTGMTEIQVWRIFASLVVLLATALVYIAVPRHLAAAGFAQIVCVGLFVAMGHIFPYWLLIPSVLILTWSLISERQPVY